MKKHVQFFCFWVLSATIVAIAGCIGVPHGMKPVEGFVVDRYLGTWYEIARLDHRFERGLEAVTANYSRLHQGEVRVVNRGYSRKEGKWKQIMGHAKSVGDNSNAHLKVSFFGPFYASYIIFGLDHQNYEYAFVSGYTTDYLWLLSRQPMISDYVMEEFKKIAKMNGFAIENLVWVNQSLNL